MTPVDKIPMRPITARMIVFESYTVMNEIRGRGTEAVDTCDLLRSCQATYVACHSALGRSLRIRVYRFVQKDLEVSP